MKIALYQPPASTYTVAHSKESGDGMVQYQRYSRISEFVEVDFPPLPTSTVVEDKLAALNSVETELRNQFEAKLGEIKTERAKLLSLTHEVTP